ncbi:MSC_0621 family F1-like ATPase epsilon subunit [Metamycoplasma buccale]|uniref:MSC_0621 family F1-like ATPase epsilon subunit n=1 Tax=Metamycoplasma buccale TaxID=55602 RepID=UPI00398E9C4D
MSKMIEQSGYDVTISFITKKDLHLRNVLIYLNLNNENNWELIKTNLLGSYDNTIIKVYDIDQEFEWYMFLKNASIFVKDDEIKINTFSKFNSYIKAKNKINIDQSLKDISKEIEYYSAKQNFGLVFDQFIELNKLKNEQYQLKMIQILNLMKGGNHE